MNKKFTKLIAALALLVFMTPSMAGWGQTTYNFFSSTVTEIPGSWSTSGGTKVINGVTWTYSSATYIALDNTHTKIQIGSGNKPQTSDWTIQTPITSFGTDKMITEVSIIAYTKNTTATYDISVGGTSVKSGDLTTSSATYTASNLNVTSGDIIVTLKGSSGSAAMYLSNIVVTYDDASTDPSITISEEDLQLPYTENEEGIFNVTYTNFEPALAFARLYTSPECEQGQEFPTTGDDAWIMVDVDEDPSVINYTVEANNSATERTVYMKVEALDNDENIVSEVFTITQAGMPTYTVTYNANGAESGVVPTDATQYTPLSNTVTVLGNVGSPFLAKTGYSWSGWCLNAEGTGTVYGPGDNQTHTYTISADTTFHAKWTINSHNVGLPADDVYGTYTMDKTNPVAYGTEVTLTYTPAAGYGDYTATWSVNGTSLSGNKFTMPDEDVTVTVAMTNRKTATYTIASTSSVTASGTPPTNSSATYSQTYNNQAGQMTSGNSMQLTLSGYQGQIIKGITLSMHSNAPGSGVKGAGYMSANAGTITLASFGSSSSPVNFNQWPGMTAYTNTYTDVVIPMTNSTYVIKSGETVEICIAATANSLYCESFTIEYEPSTDPIVNVTPASREVDYQAHNSTSENLDFVVSSENITSPNYTLVYCNASGTVLEPKPEEYDWFTPTLSGTTVSFTTTENTGGDRTAYFKVYATVGSEPVYSGLISVAQSHQLATYTLATSLEAGKRYIIASGYNGIVDVMSSKNGDVRSCISATVASNQITEVDGLYEVVISGSGTSADPWTIFDVTYGGYLCSKKASGAYLGAKTPNDAYGQWTISFGDNGAASIEANVVTSGDNNKNKYLRYNQPSNGTPRFACYQNTTDFAPVYFFKKNDENYNYLLDIAKHTSNSGWNFIASPIAENVIANVYAGTDGADLYYYDEPSHTWMNYKNNHASDFTFANGVGYLYANSNDVTLIFTGTPLVSGDTKEIGLSYTETAGNLAGWNLVGNPFTSNAHIDRSYYVIGIDDETGKNIIVASEGGAIAPYTGVMVQAESSEDNITFTRNAPANPSNGNLQMTVAHQATTRGTSATIDNAILSFNEGSQLGKFYFGENDANLYIPQGEKEYAIATSEGQGEMPLNFRANADGQYTLTVNPEGVEMNYLHLIDNMTGNDIDLLQTPSYSFNAKTTDYESRFRLVFAANNESGVSASSTTFAFYSNGNWMVNNEGEATLQVIDVMGRVLSNQTISGTAELNLNQQAGVYVLRLVNGNDVKTQKIVVK